MSVTAVKIEKSYFSYNGKKYFRGSAEDIQLGSIGKKRTSLFKQNYLEVKDHIPAGSFKEAKATTLSIEFSNESKKNLNLGASAIVDGVRIHLSGYATFNKINSGELKLVKITVENNKMEHAANQSRSIIRNLISWGNKARIVHQVFIVMEASLADKFENAASIKVTGNRGKVEASIDGGISGSGGTSVDISAESCFAYLLAKIKWDANKKKNKTKIVDLISDQWGAG